MYIFVNFGVKFRDWFLKGRNSISQGRWKYEYMSLKIQNHLFEIYKPSALVESCVFTVGLWIRAIIYNANYLADEVEPCTVLYCNKHFEDFSFSFFKNK